MIEQLIKMHWLSSPLINTVHGFSTRHGGVSPEPFNSLNLGGSDDLPGNIEENRRRALGEFQIGMHQVSYLNQIHSATVCQAKIGKQTGDALVSNEKNIAIAVGAADCYPILFYDGTCHVIGAAHCGWRGTVNRIVRNTIGEMVRLGSKVNNIKVAIGQGISVEKYEVGGEVIDQFRENNFPQTCWQNRNLDLLEANKFVAEESGILKENIWCMNRCTTESDFFSYRRDQGKTGRMWGVIMLK
jgi:YfiH family protein